MCSIVIPGGEGTNPSADMQARAAARLGTCEGAHARSIPGRKGSATIASSDVNLPYQGGGRAPYRGSPHFSRSVRPSQV